MAQPKTNKLDVRKMSPRARLYGMALVITLSYMLIGRLNNDSDSWVQVSLPLSSASLLLLSLSGAETYLYVQRVQRNHEELEAARVREIELSQRVAFERQSTLNQISCALIDKLDVTHIATDVLEKITQLFEADVIAAWVTATNGKTHFSLKGAFGFTTYNLKQLEELEWAFPAFDKTDAEPHQIIINQVTPQALPTLADICGRESIASAVLSPVVRRKELVGLIGIFYRKPREISPSLAAEMQTVANIIASAVGGIVSRPGPNAEDRIHWLAGQRYRT
jgi:transcriptional regulator with GAF, ATPase, and Fis domain